MADTGIILRRDIKANLLIEPPIEGEIVFATDTLELGALIGWDVLWVDFEQFSDAERSKLESIEEGAQVNAVTTVNGDIGDIIINKLTLGLENVDNTSDLDKPISNATSAALDNKVNNTNGIIEESLNVNGSAHINGATNDGSPIFVVSDSFNTPIISVNDDKNIIVDALVNFNNVSVNVSTNALSLNTMVGGTSYTDFLINDTLYWSTVIRTNGNLEFLPSSGQTDGVLINGNRVLTTEDLGVGLDADLLDGYHGEYYLNWNNATNKPSPMITLGGDLSGNVVLNELNSGTLTATVQDDSHIHTFSTITGLGDALDSKLDVSLKGVPNGLAELNYAGKIPSEQLPAYVDDIIEVPDYASLPVVGESGKIYVTTDDSSIYRWSGSVYIEINSTVGTAEEAIKLSTPRLISLGGDLSGSASFDGSADITINAEILPGSHYHDDRYIQSGDFEAKRLDVTQSSYRKRVVLLFPMSTANEVNDRRVVGRLVMSKTGSNIFDAVDVYAQTAYNNTYCTIKAVGQNPSYFKAVTVTHNAVPWLAIEPFYQANPYNTAMFYGFAYSDTNPEDVLNIINYHDTLNDIILDQEIYDSITPFVHPLSHSDMYINTFKMWHSGNDGSGSTLDADLLDGQHGSYYQDRANHTGTQPISTVSGLQTELDSKVNLTDPRLTDAREWTADTVTQVEAEAGTNIVRKAWTAQRVRQAINSVINSISNATQTVAGWMSPEDKTKLDGIETGATADQTKADIDALGIDAATLDGVPIGDFRRTSTTSTAIRSYTIVASQTNLWTLRNPFTDTDVTTSENGYIYRVRMSTLSTGTDAGVLYLLDNKDGLGWRIHKTTVNFTGSNHPKIVIDAGLPKVTTDHANDYSIRVIIEAVSMGNTGSVLTAFGADANISSQLGVLYFTDANLNNHKIWHETNFDPASKSDSTHLHDDRYVKIGDFGSGNTDATDLPGDDIDSGTIPTGISYRVDDNTTGTKPPGLVYGLLTVEKLNSTTQRQVFKDYTSEDIYTRIYPTNGPWGSWVKIWHSGNLDPNTLAIDGHTHTISDVTGLQTALDSKVSLTGDESISGVKTFTTGIAITGTSKAAGRFYAGTVDPTNTTRTNYDGNLHANAFGTGRYLIQYNAETETLDFNFE